ncbi:hypothetical protein PQZ47_01905, partial [Candidatus Pelagibacter sp.]|nr:hypothetical protein [Candidatus Pelagibacter sp.]
NKKLSFEGKGQVKFQNKYELIEYDVTNKGSDLDLVSNIELSELDIKNLKNSLKQRTFFKDLRKEVETGANGTQDYVVKKGVNKDTVATTRQ